MIDPNELIHVDKAWELVGEHTAQLQKDVDDWRDLAERAIAQIEQWRLICERWEQRYNQLKARDN